MIESIREYFTQGAFIDLLSTFLLNLVLALVIYILGRWLGKFIQNLLEKVLRKRQVDEVLVNFLGTIAFVLILLLTIVAALDKLGIPATSLIAVVGAAGLAVGLALKDSLSNFASGVMLVLFRPFTKGDYVDAGGESGTVDEVWLMSTQLITPDNKVLTVPNGLIWSDTIINYSARPTRRIDMVIGVGYDDDLKKAAEILTTVCREHPKVLDEPAIKVFVTNLGDSSVDFAVRPWVKTEDYWGVRAEILETAKAELEAAGCNIPYPQTDVHLHQAPTEEQ